MTDLDALAAELREARKRVSELEAEIQVRDNSATAVFDTLKAALPNRGFHSEMEAAEAAAKEIGKLRQQMEVMTDVLLGSEGIAIDGELGPTKENFTAWIDALARQNAALRAALEPFVDAIGGNYSHQADEMTIYCGSGAWDLRMRLRLRDWRKAVSALALTPPAALEALRRRERSIGAEEELRFLAAEECESVFPGDVPHITRTQLLDRADAIAAERDHIADVGKKVNHPAIPDSSGGVR